LGALDVASWGFGRLRFLIFVVFFVFILLKKDADAVQNLEKSLKRTTRGAGQDTCRLFFEKWHGFARVGSRKSSDL
jgi:hypothetical protein